MRSNTMPGRLQPASRNQRGAALIVAILIMGFVAIIATSMTSDFQLVQRRIKNQLLNEQAYHYMLGVEEWAKYELLEDWHQDKERGLESDHMHELWANLPPHVDEEGSKQAVILDLQGRFNINSLVYEAPEGSQVTLPATAPQRYFIRLLLSLDLELEPAEALAILEAVVDWLDHNQNETGFGGAEDQAYAELPQPYRTADGLFQAPSELRLVKHMTEEIYLALEPHITVWPLAGAEASAININTATGAVLAAIGQGDDTSVQPLDPQAMDALIAARGDEGFASVQDFSSHPVWGGAPPALATLDIKSRFFLVQSVVILHGHEQRLTSVLWRDIDNDEVRVLARSLGGF